MFYNSRRILRQLRGPRRPPVAAVWHKPSWIWSLLFHQNGKIDILQGICWLYLLRIGGSLRRAAGKGFKDLLNILEPGYTVLALETVVHERTTNCDELKGESFGVSASKLLAWSQMSLLMKSYMTVTVFSVRRILRKHCSSSSCQSHQAEKHRKLFDQPKIVQRSPIDG